MPIEKLEEQLSSHIILIYNNIALQENAIIDPDLVTEIQTHIEQLNKYDSITILLNSRGGNLASGYKIISMLREKYKEINTIIMDRCGSTATFMALSSDNLYATPNAIITPTEPQMETYINQGENISISVITNYLKEKDKHPQSVETLDPLTFGNYYSTISYFKQLCYNTYHKDKAEKIIKFMLEEVNSHQLPLLKSDFEKMGIELLPIPENLSKILREYHRRIIYYFKNKDKSTTRHTLVKSSKKTSIYEKQYDEKKHKIAEGYFIIEEEEFMKKSTIQNARVNDILNETSQQNNEQREYADAASHWDSYSDSYYHDEYQDTYDDYGDSSYYHDEYRDSIQLDSPKIKQKTMTEKK